jgi:hypothetical protein
MTDAAIRTALKHQYAAAIITLEQIISDCPPSLWTDASSTNPFWQIAYHALYYTDLYLEQRVDDYQNYKIYREEHYRFDPNLPNLRPYTSTELVEYCQFCREKAERVLDKMDLEQADSGFPWYRMSKLEHQIVNIRHLQHHAAQLSDRLRNVAGKATRWVQGG